MFFNKNLIIFLGVCLLLNTSSFPADAGRTAQESPGFVKGKTPTLEAPNQTSSKPPITGVQATGLNASEKVRLKVEGHLKKSREKGKHGDDFFLDIWVQSESKVPVKNLRVECEIYYRQKDAPSSGKNGFDNVTRVYKQFPDKILYKHQWAIAELKKFLDSQHYQTPQLFFNHDYYQDYSGYKVAVYNQNGQLLAIDKD
jgi:hypothetical protein